MGEPTIKSFLGGIKMQKIADCQPDIEVFDLILLDLFERWRHRRKQHRDELELKYANWLEDFCSYVWKSLEKFEDTGRLREPLRR